MNRDFKGIWIPKEIWLDENLKIIEKVFLVEIDSLDNSKGCYATNTHFSKFFNLSKSRCSEIINSLIKKGYVNAYYHREGEQIVERILKVATKYFRCSENMDTPFGKQEEPIRKTRRTPSENTKESNTVNNTVNNTEKASSKNHIKEYYNTKLLEIGLTQQDINTCIFANKKERQQHSKLLNMLTDDNYKVFFDTAFKDNWLVKEKSCMPSILVSQFSTIYGSTKVTKFPTKKPTFEQWFNQVSYSFREQNGWFEMTEEQQQEFYERCVNEK